jgi:hypothetical protein
MIDPALQAEVDGMSVDERLARPANNAWSPEFFGIVDGTDLPAALATNPDDHLAGSGFGRDSL